MDLEYGDILVNCRDCEYHEVTTDTTEAYWLRDNHTTLIMNFDANPDHDVAIGHVRGA